MSAYRRIPGPYRIVAFVMSVLLGITVGFTILFNLRYKPLIENGVRQLVHSRTQGLYSVTFNSASTQILVGKIVLKDIRFIRDTAQWAKLKKVGLAPCRQYALHIDRLVIFLENLPQLWLHQTAYINLVKAENPTLELQLEKGHCQNESSDQGTGLLAHKGDISAFVLRKFAIKGGQVRVLGPDRAPLFQAGGVVLNADSVHWDTHRKGLEPLLLLLHQTHFTLVAHHIYWAGADRAFSLTASRVFYSNLDKVLEIDSLKGQNHLQGLAAGEDTTRTQVKFMLKNIAVSGFNLDNHWQGRSLKAGVIRVNGGDLYFSDKSHGLKKVPDQDLPQTYFSQLRCPISIQSLKFNEIHIRYTDSLREASSPGILDFYHTSGETSPFESPSVAVHSPEYFRLRFSSSLFDQGRVAGNLALNMKAAAQNFTLTVEVYDFPIASINPMLTPLTNIKVLGGGLSTLNFLMTADRLTSECHVKALYKNLRVKFTQLPHEPGQDQVKALSVLANTFLILNNNPLVGEPPRRADYTYAREPGKSIFSYVWKSLFTGLKPILGLIPGRETGVHSFIQQLNHFKSWDRSGRVDRKKNRILRQRKRTLRRVNRSLNVGVAPAS